MYAIAVVVYGLPLVSNEDQPKRSKGFAEFVERATDEEGRDGFLSYYSGSAEETPAAFGVKLGEFDEACAYVDVSSLPLTPTEEQKAAFQALWDGLNDKERAMFKPCGEPRVFFLWTTS